MPTNLVGRLGYRVGFREGAQPVNASQSYKGKDASTCRSNLGEARSKQIPIRLNRRNGSLSPNIGESAKMCNGEREPGVEVNACAGAGHGFLECLDLPDHHLFRAADMTL